MNSKRNINTLFLIISIVFTALTLVTYFANSSMNKMFYIFLLISLTASTYLLIDNLRKNFRNKNSNSSSF